MARTYTKKTKMNTITEFCDLLSPEEMEFFPSLDLSLPEFGDDIDDVFQRNTTTLPKTPSQEFSADEILQELNFEGGDKLLETDWFTQKFDFSSFDSSLANTSETLQDFSQVEGEEFGSSLAELNGTFLTKPVAEEQLTIPLEMPTTPEQKVPEYAAVSPYSIDSAASPVCMSEGSNESSPCSPFSSSDSTVSLTDLLINDSGSFISFSPSKQMESQNNASERVTPYFRNTSNTKPKGKTPAQRQRKRVQNKDAATRYRVKKRSELEILFDESEQAEKENSELKDQVASISKEIEYLKKLMLEVYKNKKKKNKQLR